MITANSGSFSLNWGLFGLGVASKHNTVSPPLHLVFCASATYTNALNEFWNMVKIILQRFKVILSKNMRPFCYSACCKNAGLQFCLNKNVCIKFVCCKNAYLICSSMEHGRRRLYTVFTIQFMNQFHTFCISTFKLHPLAIFLPYWSHLNLFIFMKICNL